jgi:DNA-binding MarR family transcriptional regulator
MTQREEELYEVLENLLRLRNQCSCTIFSECGLSDITVKQIAYLKTIDEHGDITLSRLAEITRNSKPTITEMVNKFVRMECVYREPSPDDGRIIYIRLTEKWKKIAHADRLALQRMMELMMESLEGPDQELLIGLLEKVR